MNMNDHDDLLNEDGSIKLPNPLGMTAPLSFEQPNVLTGVSEDALKPFESLQNISGIGNTPTVSELMNQNSFGHINRGIEVEYTPLLSTGVPPSVPVDPGLLNGTTDTFQTSTVLSNTVRLNMEAQEKEQAENEKERMAKQQEVIEKKIEELEKISTVRKDVYIYDPKKLVRDHPLSESPYIRSFLNKIDEANRKLNWKCAFCGRFLKDAPTLDCYSAIERLYEQFSEGQFVPCAECRADNFFIITTDTIVFNCIQSLTADPIKHTVDKYRKTDA